MSRRPYKHVPALTGWIVSRTMWRQILSAEDCTAGHAQEAFKRKCLELQQDGWTLEDSKYDSRFAHRGADRLQIGIEAADPYNPPPMHKAGPS